jgi:hypothetical protein
MLKPSKSSDDVAAGACLCSLAEYKKIHTGLRPRVLKTAVSFACGRRESERTLPKAKIQPPQQRQL